MSVACKLRLKLLLARYCGSIGKEDLKADRRVCHCKEVGLQEWPLAGRATVPRGLYSIGLCMSLRRRTILSKSLRAPAPVDLTIHTFRTVNRTAGRHFAVVARFGKRWEFGDNHEVCKAFVCQYASPHSCCGWGPAEAERCMRAPRRLHWMASVMVMWSTLNSHSANATFRRPNRFFFHLHSSLKL